jgi:hypothetical protein
VLWGEGRCAYRFLVGKPEGKSWHLLALLGAHLILHISRIRVKKLLKYFKQRMKCFKQPLKVL